METTRTGGKVDGVDRDEEQKRLAVLSLERRQEVHRGEGHGQGWQSKIILRMWARRCEKTDKFIKMSYDELRSCGNHEPDFPSLSHEEFTYPTTGGSSWPV